MSKKLLKNLHLINPCSENAFIESAFVLISGKTIESVGSTLPAGDFDEIHDLGGKVALPGMINAHHHLYSSLAIGMPLPKNSPANFVEKLKIRFSPYCSVATWYLWRSIDDEPIQY